MNKFDSIQLAPPIQKALKSLGYETPTPVQAQAIPPAVAGQDVLGCAQTGTGKTAAFALPILDYLENDRPEIIPNQPTTLVLAPTRELAIQIGDSFRDYAKHLRIRLAVIHGGVNQVPQVKQVRRGVDVLVATPGRLLDLMNQGHIDLSGVEIFVLDEADRMLDMGFLPALKKIIADLPKNRQSLFFSATMPPKIQSLAGELLFNPVSIDVTPKTKSVDLIRQSIRYVRREEKLDCLHRRLTEPNMDRAIVFTRTKHGANALVRKLDRQGVVAAAIHGNKSQSARQRALDAFRDKKISVLVATDVAARGIDIAGVSHVINFDMPVEAESYVHRIGRTGRAGCDGIAISFCTADEIDELRSIEKLIGRKIDIENPDAKFRHDGASADAGKPARSSRSGNRSGGQARQNRRRDRSGSTSGRKRQSRSAAMAR
ncbi:DEAD/DEAH box helicase [Crateriforma conspicua]|uniref:DEAD/DEAH box helicase n=1 Tax=Crateriforma conspicua TaxID=2527996 RepID=UPI00118907A4|nr:DEAD/DEAH box helicase [Crateriforma conspicua]QDV63151.1 ATP-dependent RNA helicase RhlE [Crateriforma conspicua]